MNIDQKKKIQESKMARNKNKWAKYRISVIGRRKYFLNPKTKTAKRKGKYKAGKYAEKFSHQLWLNKKNRIHNKCGNNKEPRALCQSVVKSSPRNISFNLDLRYYCLCYGNDENSMDKTDGSLLVEKQDCILG